MIHVCATKELVLCEKLLRDGRDLLDIESDMGIELTRVSRVDKLEFHL